MDGIRTVADRQELARLLKIGVRDLEIYCIQPAAIHKTRSGLRYLYDVKKAIELLKQKPNLESNKKIQYK
jgi:hypothetical protein